MDEHKVIVSQQDQLYKIETIAEKQLNFYKTENAAKFRTMGITDPLEAHMDITISDHIEVLIQNWLDLYHFLINKLKDSDGDWQFHAAHVRSLSELYYNLLALITNQKINKEISTKAIIGETLKHLNDCYIDKKTNIKILEDEYIDFVSKHKDFIAKHYPTLPLNLKDFGIMMTPGNKQTISQLSALGNIETYLKESGSNYSTFQSYSSETMSYWSKFSTENFYSIQIGIWSHYIHPKFFTRRSPQGSEIKNEKLWAIACLYLQGFLLNELINRGLLSRKFETSFKALLKSTEKPYEQFINYWNTRKLGV